MRFPLFGSVAFSLAALSAAQPAKPGLDTRFEQDVRPFMTKYCVGCHSGKQPAAQFDLKSYKSVADVTREFPRWHLVMERLSAKTMPPVPMPAPPADQVKKVTDWIEGVKAEEIRKYAGDPESFPHAG